MKSFGRREFKMKAWGGGVTELLPCSPSPWFNLKRFLSILFVLTPFGYIFNTHVCVNFLSNHFHYWRRRKNSPTIPLFLFKSSPRFLSWNYNHQLESYACFQTNTMGVRLIELLSKAQDWDVCLYKEGVTVNFSYTLSIQGFWGYFQKPLFLSLET